MKCKKCGCDFPNLEIYENGCSNCESPKQMFKREMKKLHALSEKNEHEKTSKYIITVNESVIAFYAIDAKSEKDAEKYFFDNLAKVQTCQIGSKKEINGIISIEKADDSNFLKTVKCNKCNET